MIRQIIVHIMVLTFVVLGVIDLCAGDIRRGLAGLLLGCAQALLFF